MADAQDAQHSCRRFHMSGVVQGIGMRPALARLARQFDLCGRVHNCSDGVTLIVEGTSKHIAACSDALNDALPPQARLQSCTAENMPLQHFTDFRIEESQSEDSHQLHVSPDLATCADCLADIHDPANRRYHYPFTSCARCGPRLTIVNALPYDRSRSSMASFTMCNDCQREYDDSSDRRYHAQTNACPACGPQLQFFDADGDSRMHGDVCLEAAAAILHDGGILALQGLGGFQLCCDARNADSIARLRRLKQRPSKALAIMAPDMNWVHAHCHCSDSEEEQLQSTAAPIVLVNPRADNGVCDQVRAGAPELGVMLPCTPLHHLLLTDLQIPIVATSGNRHGRPLCINAALVHNELSGMADGFVVHDRQMLRRADDSLLRVVDGRVQMLRRARGYVPLQWPLPAADQSTVSLAVGSQQHNAPALLNNGQVLPLCHVGDLGTQHNCSALEQTLADMQNISRQSAQSIVHDEHPDYAATQFALQQPQQKYAVQHHLAHACSVLLEHGLDTSTATLALIADGTGYGRDGTIWGCEALFLHQQRVTRVAHLQSFRLPGGEAAVHSPWRTALALLYAANAAERCPAGIRQHSTSSMRVNIQQMLKRQLRAPLCSSLGRLFDAVASLLDICHEAQHEAQAAVALEAAAADTTAEAYTLTLSNERPLQIDWQPLLLQILDDIENERPVADIAAAFHSSIVEVFVAIAAAVESEQVVLNGGCFYNRRLLSETTQALDAAGHRVLRAEQLPAGDGGLAAGQLAAAQWHVQWQDH